MLGAVNGHGSPACGKFRKAHEDNQHCPYIVCTRNPKPGVARTRSEDTRVRMREQEIHNEAWLLSIVVILTERQQTNMDVNTTKTTSAPVSYYVSTFPTTILIAPS